LSLRVLFSSGPGVGHILPGLPLARAFRERGDEVALLTAEALYAVVATEDIEFLAAGPGPDVLVAEITRRTGANLLAGPPSLEVEAELFAGTRVDLGFDESLEAAKKWRPDLIVSEHYDFVGPLIGAALEIPVAALAYGPAMNSALAEATSKVVAPRYSERGLTRRASRWYLDTCPSALQHDAWQEPAHRIGLRPEAHRTAAAAATPAQAPTQTQTTTDVSRERPRPTALVTFGTVFNAPEMLTPLLRALAAAGLDLRVTTGLFASADDFDISSERVSFVPFTPLNELLQNIDLVLSHGGAGTTLGGLAAGIPLVIVPQGADQFIQADRVTAAKAGLAVTPDSSDLPKSVADAVAAVLNDPTFREHAREVAAQIAALPAPADVATQLAAALRS
jgi:UDP:flavonoid glycosyltransferase YjiC (YdhE family)